MATYRIPVGRFTVVIDAGRCELDGEGKILDPAGNTVPYMHTNNAMLCLKQAERLEAEAARKDVIHARWDHLETAFHLRADIDGVRELRRLTGWAKDEPEGGNP